MQDHLGLVEASGSRPSGPRGNTVTPLPNYYAAGVSFASVFLVLAITTPAISLDRGMVCYILGEVDMERSRWTEFLDIWLARSQMSKYGARLCAGNEADSAVLSPLERTTLTWQRYWTARRRTASPSWSTVHGMMWPR